MKVPCGLARALVFIFSFLSLGYEFILLGEENANLKSAVKFENGEFPTDFLLVN